MNKVRSTPPFSVFYFNTTEDLEPCSTSISRLVVCLSGRRGPAVNRVHDAALVRIQQPPRLAAFWRLFFYQPRRFCGVSYFGRSQCSTRGCSSQPATHLHRVSWCDPMTGHETRCRTAAGWAPARAAKQKEGA